MTARALAFGVLLLSTAPSLAAQTPALRAGDTVRVWRRGSTVAIREHVVAVTADSLTLRTHAFALADVTHIDVARGTTMNRGKMAAFIIGGIIPGAFAGYSLRKTIQPCAGCDVTADAIRFGAILGAGGGWLLARKYATQPMWFAAWPRPPEPQIAEQAAVDSARARRIIEPALFVSIKSGSLIRVWVRGSGGTFGKFGSVSADESSMQWRDKPSAVPLRSIDALEVGQRHPVLWTVLGATAVTAPVALLAGLACALGPCEGDRVGLVLGSAAFIGGTVGAVVGNSRVSWKVRFSR